MAPYTVIKVTRLTHFFIQPLCGLSFSGIKDAVLSASKGALVGAGFTTTEALQGIEVCMCFCSIHLFMR